MLLYYIILQTFGDVRSLYTSEAEPGHTVTESDYVYNTCDSDPLLAGTSSSQPDPTAADDEDDLDDVDNDFDI